MEHTYKYTILTAIPDPRRGERVNIGIVVFKGNELDVRFQQASAKLRALTGRTLESQIQSIAKRIKAVFNSSAPPDDILKAIGMIDPIISPVGFGAIHSHDASDYEKAISEILSSLVVPPRHYPEPSPVSPHPSSPVPYPKMTLS